jgi:hypothetical protein
MITTALARLRELRRPGGGALSWTSSRDRVGAGLAVAVERVSVTVIAVTAESLDTLTDTLTPGRGQKNRTPVEAKVATSPT